MLKLGKQCAVMFLASLCLVVGMTGLKAHAGGKELTLGCLPYSEPMVRWAGEGLEANGYKVKILMFDANQLPATALKDGNLDGIIANHRPWIMTFNRENGCELDMVEPYYFHSYFAVYSTKYDDLSALPKNALVAVPGDPTNLSRSLIILKEAGLITLGDKHGDFHTIMDIRDNPRKIRILETEITQTARSIDDADAVVSTAYFVGEAAKGKKVDNLFEDPQNREYALGLIVRREDMNSEWTRKVMETLRSPEYRQKFDDHFQGKYTMYP